MLPPTVRHGNRRGCWNTTPAPRPGTGAVPPTRTVPPVGCSNPAISRSSVLLPQPDAPTRTRNSPAGTVRSTGPTATTSPYACSTPVRVTASAEDIGQALDVDALPHGLQVGH